MRRAMWVAAALLLGCGRFEAKKQGEPAETRAAGVVKKVGVLSFHEDDYEGALAEARRRKVPLFVDTWAPWCHTCLSLQAYVLADPSLAPLADRYVFLAIDTEREKNAEFVKKFPVAAWPTLWVIDAASERPSVRWPGSLTVGELRDLLGEAGPGGGEAAAELLQAERAAAEGKGAEAVGFFRKALEKAPAGWERGGRAVDGLVTALHGEKRYGECAAEAKRRGPGLRGTSAGNVALYGVMCARKLDDREALRGAADALAAVVADESQPMLADDRSSLYEELADCRRDMGDKEEQKKTAARWSAFLEGQAEKAATPEARRVFDAHRMLAYLDLGEYERALAVVERSEREQPGDYNHSARVAKIHLEAGRPDEALKAIDRSLGLAYGPRRLRLFDLKARILEKKGDAAGARAAREQGVKEGEAMKLEGKQARPLEDLKARLRR